MTTVYSKELKKALTQVRRFIGKDGEEVNRRPLDIIQLQAYRDLVLCGSDGIAVIEYTINHAPNPNGSPTGNMTTGYITAATAVKIGKGLSGKVKDLATIELNAREIVINGTAYQLYNEEEQKEEGQPFDIIGELWPQFNPTVDRDTMYARLPASELARAAKICGLFAKQGHENKNDPLPEYQTLRLTFGYGYLTAAATARGVRSTRYDIPLNVGGPPAAGEQHTAGFNWDYIYKMTNHLKKEEVCFYQNKPSEPALICFENVRYILMPCGLGEWGHAAQPVPEYIPADNTAAAPVIYDPGNPSPEWQTWEQGKIDSWALGGYENCNNDPIVYAPDCISVATYETSAAPDTDTQPAPGAATTQPAPAPAPTPTPTPDTFTPNPVHDQLINGPYPVKCMIPAGCGYFVGEFNRFQRAPDNIAIEVNAVVGIKAHFRLDGHPANTAIKGIMPRIPLDPELTTAHPGTWQIIDRDGIAGLLFEDGVFIPDPDAQPDRGFNTPHFCATCSNLKFIQIRYKGFIYQGNCPHCSPAPTPAPDLDPAPTPEYTPAPDYKLNRSVEVLY